jgi:hypothetical protein
MKTTAILITIALSLMLQTANATPATNINDLADISITQGQQIDWTNYIGTISISGQTANVSVNLPDTTTLATGQHTLIYSAITLNGNTAYKTAHLNIDNATPQSQKPTISGVTNLTFTETQCFDMMHTITANDTNAKPAPLTQSIPFAEWLAPGSHTLHYTAIDTNGFSTVTNCNLTVLPLSDKFRRAEWSHLGNALYTKYFEPDTLSQYFTTNTTVITAFIYGEPTTVPGISAHISLREVKFDMLSFEQHPMKIEALTARITALLKELQHHRRLWFDQPYINFTIDTRASQINTGERKERGLYLVRIPHNIFKQNNFEVSLYNALNAMPRAELRSRSDNKGKVCHGLYQAPATNIRILFEVDLIEGFAWNFGSRWRLGEVTLEEYFNADLFHEALKTTMKRYRDGDFGPISDPILPFIKQQHPAL